jgi:hypothetical protein
MATKRKFYVQDISNRNKNISGLSFLINKLHLLIMGQLTVISSIMAANMYGYPT